MGARVSNPSAAHLIKLAEVLQVSFEWLATGGEYKENKQEKRLSCKQREALDNTQPIKINQLLSKMNNQQKERLIELLNDIVS